MPLEDRLSALTDAASALAGEWDLVNMRERAAALGAHLDIDTARDTAVLMLTSFSDDQALFDSIMAGAADFVLKQVRGAGPHRRGAHQPPDRRPPRDFTGLVLGSIHPRESGRLSLAFRAVRPYRRECGGVIVWAVVARR